MLARIQKDLDRVPLWLIILALVCLLGGIVLRFSNLEGKLYSNDEAFSTTYIYGRNLAEIIDTQIVSTSQLQEYQRYRPEESLGAAFQRVLDKPYVFPPLYAFIVQIWARFWSFFLSDPATITRSCSAFISLFSLPFFYWLCWELFGSVPIAWIGTAIFAVSPLHLQYSQIVRTYSLLTAATLLSSAALLRVQRIPNRKNWLLYSLAIAIGLYSHVLFGFVLIGHGLYVIVEARGRFTRAVRHYLLASALGISLFLPWFYLFLTKPRLLGYTVSQSLEERLSPANLIQNWLKILPRIFIDLNDAWVPFSQSFLWLQRIAAPLALVLVLVSLAYTIRKVFQDRYGMILGLIVGGGGILMFKDMVLGGVFSTRPRYILPYTIGIQLAVIASIAYLFHTRSLWRRRLSEIIIAGLLVGGLLSSWIIVRAPSWWAFGAPDYPAIAQKVSQLSKPVVLYDDFADAVTMSYLFDDHVYYHLTGQAAFHLEKAIDPYRDYSDIVLFRPPKALLTRLRGNQNLVLEPLFRSKENYPNQPNAWIVRKK